MVEGPQQTPTAGQDEAHVAAAESSAFTKVRRKPNQPPKNEADHWSPSADTADITAPHQVTPDPGLANEPASVDVKDDVLSPEPAGGMPSSLAVAKAEANTAPDPSPATPATGPSEPSRAEAELALANLYGMHLSSLANIQSHINSLRNQVRRLSSPPGSPKSTAPSPALFAPAGPTAHSGPVGSHSARGRARHRFRPVAST
jgi:hypothetical protein